MGSPVVSLKVKFLEPNETGQVLILLTCGPAGRATQLSPDSWSTEGETEGCDRSVTCV